MSKVVVFYTKWQNRILVGRGVPVAFLGVSNPTRGERAEGLRKMNRTDFPPKLRLMQMI